MFNRIDRPEINPYKYSQSIFDERGKAIQEANTAFLQMGLEQQDIHMPKKK